MPTMIVGYTSADEQVFCTHCWRSRAEAGARPRRVLDTEEPDDPDHRDNFWLVDACHACGKAVKYKAVTELN